MTQHYTDAEIEAVHEFAWENRDGVQGSGSHMGAKRLLDAVAPAIAARALREAAVLLGAVGMHRAPCRHPDDECPCGVFDFRAEASTALRDRADEIEAGR
jgi:hypothetical protein